MSLSLIQILISCTCQEGQLNFSLGLHHYETNVALLTGGKDRTKIIVVLQGHCLRRATDFFDENFLLNIQGFVYIFIQERVISQTVNVH